MCIWSVIHPITSFCTYEQDEPQYVLLKSEAGAKNEIFENLKVLLNKMREGSILLKKSLYNKTYENL